MPGPAATLFCAAAFTVRLPGLDGHLLVPLSGGDAALTYSDRYDDYGDAGFRERAVRLRP